ncbi:MAG TPA: hypothetical protein VGR96_09145 [Acidobacteriaceae bacterium]|nr:hypothetical protein [Acidobacteriaceae bacterium]
MMALRLAVFAGAVSMLAAGCGDQRAANKQALEKALNRDYALNADCLFAKPLPFPYELAVQDKLLGQTRSKLDALVEAGLLSRVESVRGNQVVNRYSMTASGAQVEGKGRFCYGRRQVTSVERFTKPVNYDGMPLTKVEYRFVLKNSAGWAKQDEVRNAFPDVAKSMQPSPIDEATLILTNDGWVLTY